MSHYTGSVPDTTQAVDWRVRAACRETDRTGKLLHDPELFFPVGETGHALLQIGVAKQVCCRCPAIDDCLQYALNARIEHGVWGGLAENERRAMKRRANRRPTAAKPVADDALVFSKTAPLAEACRELYDRYTILRDGHVVWTAVRTQVKIHNRERTYGRICFQAVHGREPEGQVLRSCGVDRCVAPQCLTDRTIRAARKRATGRKAEASARIAS